MKKLSIINKNLIKIFLIKKYSAQLQQLIGAYFYVGVTVKTATYLCWIYNYISGEIALTDWFGFCFFNFFGGSGGIIC
jgi:hypothetical protein